MTTGQKLLVIGLDGATFDVLDPMLEAGRMPRLAALVAAGCRGPLRSVIPPISAPAWASFMTGKDPSNHGAFLFYHFDPASLVDDKPPRLVSSRSIQARTFWEILGDKAKRLIAINVPMTYPPWTVNGVMVAGLGTPDGSRDFVHPPEMLRELDEEFGSAGTFIDPFLPRVGGQWVQARILAEHLEVERRRAKLATRLMRTQPWDASVVVFTITDRGQHFLWHDRPAVERLYAELDPLIGELVDAAGKDTTVLVLSDHGFGSLDGQFFTNRWLREQGWLVCRRPTWKLHQFYRLTLARRPLRKVFQRLKLKWMLGLLPRQLAARSITLPYLRRREAAFIDWSRTRAYGAAYGVRVNLRGREPHGCVAPGAEYEAVRREVAEALRDVRDPRTGERVVDLVKFREEVYRGRLQDEAPDVLFMVRQLGIVTNNRLLPRRVFAPSVLTGNHRLDGILVMAGPGLRRGATVADARLVDVMPTMLHSLGLPVPDDLDGRVLAEGFEPAALAANPIRTEPAAAVTRAAATYAADDDRDVRARLTALGYMD